LKINTKRKRAVAGSSVPPHELTVSYNEIIYHIPLSNLKLVR